MTSLKAKLIETLTTASVQTFGAPILEVQAVQQTLYVPPATVVSTDSTSASTISGNLSGMVDTANILVPGGALKTMASMAAACAVLLVSLF